MLEISDDPGDQETDKASKLKGFLWLLGGCIIGVIFGVGISPLAHIVPWRWEEKLAQAVIPVEHSSCKIDKAAEASLGKIVARLYPVIPDDNKFSIHVAVEKNSDINAYANLGGYITVNSGLLRHAKSPEEIAGVLAHEMEHVHHRHIMEGAITHLITIQGIQFIFSGDPSYLNWANIILNMSFTRSQERQADYDGLVRLQHAKINNTGFEKFFERMEQTNPSSNFLSDHPSNQARTDMARSFVNKHTKPILSEEEWSNLNRYCP